MIFNECKRATQPLLEKIIALPFNQELANGTLAIENFIFYLQQDSLYLNMFSKALATIAARLPEKEGTQHFLNFSLAATAAEQALHRDYLQHYATHITEPLTPSPSCFMYTHFLMHVTTTQSIEEAVASVVPCFWIYHEVGTRIIQISEKTRNNPYQAWIDLYAGAEFATSTALIIRLFDELISKTASSSLIEKTKHAFIQSSKLEWLFWDSAYRIEKWPI